MCPAFFIRVSPASRNAKPACMNMTSTAVMTTQMVDAATSRSWFETLDIGRDPLQARARAVVHDVGHRRRPAQAVPGLVAALRRVDDRRDDAVEDLVRHHEHEHCLREEARL